MIDECTWENQESFLRLKKKNQESFFKLKNENPNHFYNHEKVSKRRKQKYMEYLECEYGYRVNRNKEKENK